MQYKRLILILAALAACKQSSQQTEQKPASEPGAAQQAAAPSGDVVSIGATLPLTGAESRTGGFYKEGYDLAFEEANKNGGIDVGGKKMQVKLTLLDDTSAQATAASLADRLINSDKVNFLLGTYATNLVEAQSVVAEQNQIPYVNGGGAATAIYKRGYKWVFGLLAPVELLAESIMNWLDSEQAAGHIPKPATIALLWENTSHGKDFRKGVTEHADKTKTYTVAVDESFELSGKDFSALLGKVKAADADLFLADAHLPDYITMQRQYVTAGLCHKVTSYGARGSEKQAVDALGKKNVEYIVSAVWWAPQLAEKNPEAKKFVDLFKAKYNGRVPEWYQALGYETARALFVAISQAGSLDREAVRQKLAAMKVPSLVPGGTLEFPAQFGQQIHAPFVVMQNMPDGSAPIIAPADSATAKGIAPDPNCGKK
ncbi:MAG TPA: amino acid ABC transporter substrate-binding protein [Myxococcales bacterium]|nr:amino acid ABC transporter substrate-binding protein [Myxococcales bacterium]